MSSVVRSSRSRSGRGGLFVVLAVASGIIPAAAFARPADAATTAPGAPSVSSSTYPAGTFGGGPGVPGDFTFTPAGTGSPVDHYIWRLDDSAPQNCVGSGAVKPAVPGGPATTTITPASSGFHVLSAWACDSAQTSSARTDYSFAVKDAAAPVAAWQFEGDSRSQFPGLRYAGAGSAPFAPGKLGQASAVSGQPGDYLATSARVLDLGKSFSVSAWADAADLSKRRVVLSQDGTRTSGFALQYLDTGKWAFSLSGSDVANPVVRSAVSTAAPATGVWTHLTGVYDASAHTATLYVDGQAQQTVPATASGGVGPLVLGGGLAAGARADLFHGSIDEVAAFGRALSAADVTTLYHQNGVPTGLSATREYTLDGDTADATGADGTLTGTNLAYGPGYSDSPGRSATDDSIGHGRGQALAGTGAATSSPVVDTAGALSVSAWVKLDKPGCYTFAAQGGAFSLGATSDSLTFGLSTTGGLWRWAKTPIAPHLGKWTHLTGVHDVLAGKERLYVDGTLAAETTIPAGTAWRSTGPFRIGAFAGSIDQVQVWDRAVPAAEVADLANTAVLRANYQLDGTTTDAVSGVTATPGGSFQLTTDDNGANVARFPFDGGAQVEGPRPQNFRSDRSFTAEAWVKHTWTAADVEREKQRDPSDPAGVDKAGRTALGANSASTSPYLLGYRGVQDPDGTWRPRLSWTLGTTQVTPDGNAESGVWTHLAGTYDAVTHQACLYATTDAFQFSPKCVGNVTGWNGASDLEDLFLGHGRFNGQDSDYWYGDLRGVRVYSGVLDQQHINVDAILDHP
ncbi:LamG domain-containing protein [Amycolatopsis sp., V23-08]|uniref:LamG domain-containing protein n=1 Tax=Amycolatopsis heterodermiae TaxID=3110235 RepID=A0ABU5QXQ2_9PSEU|nr:LamG domain-containing protein [Amycolatopsis sp., V23-08]MEA5358702.1 LamG domain-containing protein [Amycolatopsis sp., V23-08]